MAGAVISLCDLSGRMVEPWSAAGHRCFIVDLQHKGTTTTGTITRIGADILACVSNWLPLNTTIRIAFGFPPCTHTAVSGARHFISKGPAGAAHAFTLIARCHQLLKWFNCPWFYEQPVATTSTYCGPPTHMFNPCDFAGYAPDPSQDAYTKKTCLWTGGGFKMPEPRQVEPLKVCSQGSWIQTLGGSSARTKNLRSATPRGFAQAVFEANR
jgi:hypothetical protein